MSILPSDVAKRSSRPPVKLRAVRVEFASFELEDFMRAELLLRDGHKCLMCFGRKFPLNVYTHLSELDGQTVTGGTKTKHFGLLCDRCGRYGQEATERPGFLEDFQIKCAENDEDYHSPLTCDCGCRSDAPGWWQAMKDLQKHPSEGAAFDASVTLGDPLAPTPLSMLKSKPKGSF